MNRMKNPHKATLNWNGKGWKIHQMIVIFHKRSLFQTPSQQGAILENDQEGVTGSSQWAPYSLGRRDVPPDNLIKKVFSEPFACLLHRCLTNNLYFLCAFQKMVHVCYNYQPKHLSYALVWSWVCVLFLSSVHRLSTLTIPLPTSHITHTWLSHLLPPLPPQLLIAWSTNRVMMGWWAKVDSTSQECRCQWSPLGDRVSTRATCLKVH